MAGLKKYGVDANPYGSKFKDDKGGYDAGNGQRTYTKPTFTLFVVGVPDAESSDAVQRVFENDVGYLQARPVGHKTSRRMVFVDYGSPEHAHKAMIAHQGHKWEDVDEGLKIDFDHDARCKRNTALDEGRFEKFWPCGTRKKRLESDRDMFARLRAEAVEQTHMMAQSAQTASVAPPQKKQRTGIAAKLQVKGKSTLSIESRASGDGNSQEKRESQTKDVKDASTIPADSNTLEAPLSGLLAYGSESEKASSADGSVDQLTESSCGESGESEDPQQ